MFRNLKISFEEPQYLLLLAVIPLILWIGRRSLAGLGPWRGGIATALRVSVCTLIVFAIAGVQWVWTSDQTAVIYLLDQSDSIPAAKREMMLRYAIENVRRHRRERRGDQAGLIVFGREAAIEFPPIDEDLPPIDRPESFYGDSDATNLEAALKLAQASFPENAARRVVVLSDGNETLGGAAATAKTLADNGVGIDVVPVPLATRAEVMVEKVDVPGNLRQGQPFEARIVINRYSENDQAVSGRLRVTQGINRSKQVLLDEEVTLDRDVNVITLPLTLEQPAGYTYEAEFIPGEAAEDAVSQNNLATAFAYVRGKGRVMLIEDAASIGEYDSLIESLRRSDIEVDVRDTRSLYTSLIELQAYDAVILAGTPRSSGEAADELQSFTDDQVEMLVAAVQQFGVGLLMVGGPDAMGAGGWANTPLEAAMPVDFQIKNSKIDAVGALAMVLHASEIASGNYWQKVIARSALDSLGPLDYCGVIRYDMLGDSWLWGGQNGMLRVGANKPRMLQLLNGMSPGDMPDFDPGLKLAYNGLMGTAASMRHMIVISDGDPTPPSARIVSSFAGSGIKISTVAVGAHGPAGHNTLRSIAQNTGGNYYVVTDAAALPKIFMREARRVSRSLVFEEPGGIAVQRVDSHETLIGLPEDFPPVRGYILTQLKNSPLVERPLQAALPNEPDVSTIMATWTYGLGRTAVFSSDAGARWAEQWAKWPAYDQFFSQLVRYLMRPSNDSANYTLATNYRDGRIEVVVNATDEDDRFLNFLQMGGAAIGPDLKPVPLQLTQQSAGRYVGSLPAPASGAYVLSIVPAAGEAPLTTGVSVPFSAEYRLRETNRLLLEQMASLTPTGGSAGSLAPPLQQPQLEQLLALDAYRGGVPPARSLRDIWPWAVIVGATLFFADCFVRRVAIDARAPLRWIRKSKARREAEAAAAAKRLDRLKATKVETTGDTASMAAPQPAAAKGYDAAEAAAAGGEPAVADEFQTSEAPKQPPRASRPSGPSGGAGSADDELSYTEKLLRAKKGGKGGGSA